MLNIAKGNSFGSAVVIVVSSLEFLIICKEKWLF